MGGSTGGYDEARRAIGSGMEEQRGLEQGAEQQFAPFQGAGGVAIPGLEEMLKQTQDPAAFLQHLMGQYQESPGLQAQIGAGEQAASRAAAQSGMLGSGAEMQHAASQAEGLRGQDMQNYLNQALGLRQQRQTGLGGLAGLGMQGAQGIAGLKTGLGQQLGQGYTGIAQSRIDEANQPSFLDQLLKGAGAIGGGFLGR